MQRYHILYNTILDISYAILNIRDLEAQQPCVIWSPK